MYAYIYIYNILLRQLHKNLCMQHVFWDNSIVLAEFLTFLSRTTQRLLDVFNLMDKWFFDIYTSKTDIKDAI